MSEDANAYLEHQRALARARQQRSRDRRRNGHVMSRLVDDNGQPNSSVQRVAEGLLRGLSHNQALIQAGSSPDARILITKAKQGLAEVLKAKALTIEHVVDSTKESIEATSPMLTADGCIERPDWSARAAGRRDAIALLDRAGELPAASQSHGGTQITVNIVRFGVTHGVTRDAREYECNDSNTLEANVVETEGVETDGSHE